MRLIHWTFVVCLFTASCDVILNFNLGGSVRLAQLLMILICMGAVARIMQHGRILWPRGGSALILWLIVQMLFISQALNFAIAAQFFVLLAFTVIGVFAVIQIYGESNRIEDLMRLYMLSFVAIGTFGLVQLATPILGLPGLYVRQWILYGKFARISGFSYEPSYYVTYLFIGWIMLLDLRISRARIAEGRFWQVATFLVGASLFLSTSRTAWVFMFVELVARAAPSALRGLRSAFREYHIGRIPIYLPGPRLALSLIAGAFLAAAGWGYVEARVNPIVFLSGTGLAGTPAHSYLTRLGGFLNTWDAFLQHPFIGPSLGGVAVYIASRSGIVLHSVGELGRFWGFPVLMDVLAASGIFGFIPFAVFLYAVTFGALRTAKRFWPEERARWLRALARAMIFEWLLLMVDQNLLRVYLWFHFSMVMLIAYHLEFARVPVMRRPVALAPLPALGGPAASDRFRSADSVVERQY